MTQPTTPSQHPPVIIQPVRSLEQVITLNRRARFDDVVQRLQHAQSRRVVLVIPPGADKLRSPVPLRRLLRYALDEGFDLTLVVRDRKVRNLAREVGFRVSPSVRKSQLQQPLDDTMREQIHQQAFRSPTVFRPGDPLVPGLWQRLRGYLVLLALVVFFGLVVTVLLPQATVVVVPFQYDLDTAFEARADPTVKTVDRNNRYIPGRAVGVQVEGTMRLETTTEDRVADARATGTVVFANRTEQPVAVFTDTILATSSGFDIRFRTTEVITVPAGLGQKAQAPIEAVEPGWFGNVAAGTINRIEQPLGLPLYVLNDKPTTGGTNKTAKIVTLADRQTLRERLQEQLAAEAYNVLQAQLRENEFLPRESLQVQVTEEVFDQEAGQEAESLGLRMRLEVGGVAFDGGAANELAAYALTEKIRPGFALRRDSVRTAPTNVLRVENSQTLLMTFYATGTEDYYVDERAIRQAVAGQTLAQAQAIVTQRWPLMESPQMWVEPDWYGRMPLFDFRIQVVVER